MRWNRLEIVLGRYFKTGNYFYDHLFPKQVERFERALGRKRYSVVQRFERDEKGNKLADRAPRDYQEALHEDREYCDQLIQLFAGKLGVTKGQAIHGIMGAKPDRFKELVYGKMYDVLTSESERAQLTRDDADKAIKSAWLWTTSYRSKKERDAAGAINEAVANHEAQVAAAKASAAPKSKSNVMKGVEVVNAKQAAKKKAVVKA